MSSNKEPKPSDYGYINDNSFDGDPLSSGWVIEGAEEAFLKALEEYYLSNTGNKNED